MKKTLAVLMTVAFVVAAQAGGTECAKAKSTCANKDKAACADKAQAGCPGKAAACCPNSNSAKKQTAKKSLASPKAAGEAGK